MDLETLYDAWERYKDLLRRCPHHGLPLSLQVQTFYNGNPSTRQMIDTAAGGTINNKTPEEVEPLNKKINGLLGSTQVHPVMRCDSSGGGVHTEYQPFNPTIEEDQVYYMGNNNFRSQNNLYSNTYNAGWRNHPNFSWGGQRNQRPQNPPGFQQPPYQQNTETALKINKRLIFERRQGSLPSNTKPNPREQLNAINVQGEEGFVEPKPEPR
ncbi:hypothetical protein CXB51_026130 [Gossypium anomalum]|uniref:Retrotransposon gag domain-containing protein n=1 Tax=Gossypium anomalum TaxID=47600 RepID=A0A8J5Y2N9_9ROSI|nr:hypothetical protein CXB51_026130 [Gossypium anomalum]